MITRVCLMSWRQISRSCRGTGGQLPVSGRQVAQRLSHACERSVMVLDVIQANVAASP
jgi:hypothetical protein